MKYLSESHRIKRTQVHPFSGSHLVVTTLHQKGQVISGPFHRSLGVEVSDSTGIDTDQLGTFSGEIERKGGPKEIVHKKALLGFKYKNARFSVATEGSFGPNPLMPMLPGHHEIMVLVDQQHNVAIYEQMIFDRTNFGTIVIKNPEKKAFHEFLKKYRFGSHALIVRSAFILDLEQPRRKRGFLVRSVISLQPG